MNHAEPNDPYWNPIDYGRAAATMPATVMTAGWHDIFLPWQVKDFLAAQQAGRDVRLIVGPWMHADMRGFAESLRETIALFQQQTGLGAHKPAFCLYGCFSKPQAVVWGRASPVVSENLARVSVEVCF